MAASACPVAARPPSLVLLAREVPPDGLVFGHVDMSRMPAIPGQAPADLRTVKAMSPDGSPIPLQFVPDEGAGGSEGVMILRLSLGRDREVLLTPGAKAVTQPLLPAGPIDVGPFSLRFDPARMAGFPSAVTFAASGKRFDSFAWNDRVYDPQLGGFDLRFDRAATQQVMTDGSLCTVVRIRAAYCREDGQPPASHPRAVYDWYLFKGLPLAWVTATVDQDEPFAWNELHFLELNFPGKDFPQFAGGDPPQSGALLSGKKSTRFDNWGALVDGQDAIGMLGEPITLYDGRGEYGTYLHSTWTTWNDRRIRFASWVWIGSARDPAASIRQAASRSIGPGPLLLTRTDVRERIQAALDRSAAQPGAAGSQARWRAALAERLEAAGRLGEAAEMLGKALPEGWSLHTSGECGLGIERTGTGLAVGSLFDLKAGRELLSALTLPVFSLTLRRAGSQDELKLDADSGWKSVRVEGAAPRIALHWADPADARLTGMKVVATAIADPKNHAWRWSIKVDTQGTPCSVLRTAFPQVALAEPGETGDLLVPSGPGVLQRGVWTRPYSYHAVYPGGWCTFQMMAAYGSGARASGLYFGLHDPFGSTKSVTIDSDPASRSVKMAYEQPAPDMGRAGNGFAMSGEAVWQLLRGDWFDAAKIYRAWAQAKAAWWPRTTADGRPDTPLWMKELPAWAQTGGSPAECVEPVKAFQKFLGVPVGFHWYSWHQIPFDDDYPHYFPTKPGVTEGVKDLQASGVYVMPYINGRLWDTRDRGLEDWEFTSLALPSATKDESGKPYIESYASKESDGSPVRLAVMCPTTALWQKTIRETVLRLMNEVGVKGVYIDQIGAATPELCMDASHGHPLGGGHWWTEGYWKLLASIRDARPADTMITTECNAEPYAHRIDGYLTWHWQSDGQVPVFPAIYGGKVQLFGRSYAEGPTRDLALRMRAGQQLTFGEQIGWLSPGVVKETENAAFLRKVVRLRYRFRRYFYAGEMARPPRLNGDIPTVRADWQWGGEDWVTTPALLTGAWAIPAEKRLVLLFANVSDQPVKASLKFDGAAYGIPAAHLQLSVLQDPDGDLQTESVSSRFERQVEVPGRAAMAWEVKW